MATIPEEFLPIAQELYPLRGMHNVSVHYEPSNGDAFPAYLRLALPEQPDFNKFLNIYLDVKDPGQCQVQQALVMGKWAPEGEIPPRKPCFNSIKDVPAPVTLPIKDIPAYVRKVFELDQPFVARLKNELSELIKSSQVTVTSTGQHQAVIKHTPRTTKYIIARPNSADAGSLFVDLQPQTSRALGEATADSPIAWDTLSQFVQTRLIDPPSK